MPEGNISNHGSNFPNEQARAHLMACSFAMIALCGSLWAAIGSRGCDNCHEAGQLFGRFPLAWFGAGFYAVLAAMAACTAFSRWTKIGYLAASGVHVVLLAILVRERILCGGCMQAGVAALIGGVASLAARPREWRWELAAFAVSGAVALGGVAMANRTQSQNRAKINQALKDEAQTQASAGHVKLVIYEREGCKHCLEFEERVLPQVQADLGKTLEVERREAAVTMESPTIEVVGKTSRVFEGVPDYKQLEDAIREMQ